MANSSVRPRAQYNLTQPSRRAVLKLAAVAPLVAVPIAAAEIDIAPTATSPLSDELAGYYAFVLREAAAIESAYGLRPSDRGAASAGEQRAAEMQVGSTIEQRGAWICAFTDTRSLFAGKEA